MRGKWIRISVVDCGEIITGATPSTANTLYWGGKYNFYSPTDFCKTKYCYKTERTVTEAGAKKGRIIPEKSILFTCIASVGKMAIAGKEGITNQQINTIIVNNILNYNYIYYILSFNADKIQRMAPLTAVPIINKTEFENIQLWICNERQDQQHIADILTSCDEVIEQTEKAIEKYRAIKAGMLQDLFTRGVDANGKLRPKPEDAPELYKDSPLGKIPKEWEVVDLQTILSVSSGDNLQEKNVLPGDYPVFGGNGITCYHNQYNVENPTLLIGRVGEYCGNAYISPQFAWITDNALIVSFYSNQRIDFWHIYLNYLNLNQYAFSAAQPVISGKILKKIKVLKIRLEEQNHIVEYINSANTLVYQENETLSKYLSIKQGLMKRLLTPPEGALEA